MKSTVPIFFDPAIPRKSKIVDQLKNIGKLPMPSVIEISESGTCNRVCSFCPRSDPSYPDEKKFISKKLVEKLTNELRQLDYSGLILFSGFVEPLLDKKIYSHIKFIKDNLPTSRIELVTNGDVLNVSRLKLLFDSGLSTLLISVYDGPEEADVFQRMCMEADLLPDQYVIRHRYLPKENNFGITLNNRSGMMSNAEFAIPSVSEPLNEPCYYPHYTFFIDYLGDVLICPHDWGKKRIAGNLLRESFIDIWAGKVFSFARDQLGKGSRALLPCSLCDVKGTLMGEIHKSAWDNCLEKK
jgi:MoaA/NifB/PqqE/SkfB family radical SAM enzyme